MTTEEQHEQWIAESKTVMLDRVREVVTGQMWCAEAERACALRFGISLQAAIYLVGRAGEAGLIRMSPPGYVRPPA